MLALRASPLPHLAPAASCRQQPWSSLPCLAASASARAACRPSSRDRAECACRASAWPSGPPELAPEGCCRHRPAPCPQSPRPGASRPWAPVQVQLVVPQLAEGSAGSARPQGQLGAAVRQPRPASRLRQAAAASRRTSRLRPASLQQVVSCRPLTAHASCRACCHHPLAPSRPVPSQSMVLPVVRCGKASWGIHTGRRASPFRVGDPPRRCTRAYALDARADIG